MKWFTNIVLLAAAQLAFCVPSELVKRANPSEVATIGYAATAGTTGGSGGTTTTVSTLSALNAAVQGSAKKIVIVTGTISGDTVVRVGPNTSVIGQRGATLNGVGLRVVGVSNVIIRNIKISKVKATAGDAIGVQDSSKVWLDHLDLSGDRSVDKDFYDGLIDITIGATDVTVTYCKLHNHSKTSLVGASNDNTGDTNIRVTYAYNYWSNVGSRTPSFRFGRGHIYNNFYENVGDAINTRIGAQLLIENNVFTGTGKALFSTDTGYAVARGNDWGGASNSAPGGNFNSAPYGYNLIATNQVRSTVTGGAGQTLTF